MFFSLLVNIGTKLYLVNTLLYSLWAGRRTKKDTLISFCFIHYGLIKVQNIYLVHALLYSLWAGKGHNNEYPVFLLFYSLWVDKGTKLNI